MSTPDVAISFGGVVWLSGALLGHASTPTSPGTDQCRAIVSQSRRPSSGLNIEDVQFLLPERNTPARRPTHREYTLFLTPPSPTPDKLYSSLIYFFPLFCSYFPASMSPCTGTSHSRTPRPPKAEGSLYYLPTHPTDYSSHKTTHSTPFLFVLFSHLDFLYTLSPSTNPFPSTHSSPPTSHFLPRTLTEPRIHKVPRVKYTAQPVNPRPLLSVFYFLTRMSRRLGREARGEVSFRPAVEEALSLSLPSS